jgi:hypothetical protein
VGIFQTKQKNVIQAFSEKNEPGKGLIENRRKYCGMPAYIFH